MTLTDVDRRAVAVAGHTATSPTAAARARPTRPRACGRRRSAPWSGSACSTTTSWRRRSPTRRPACAGGPPSSPPATRRSTSAPLLADADRRWSRWRRGPAASTSVVADDDARRADRAWPAATAPGRAARAESAVAALGAIGDDRGLDAILAATTDKPAIRRRAVLALAPFVDPDHPRAAEVAAALRARRSTDRDWQVRQAAEDVRPRDG